MRLKARRLGSNAAVPLGEALISRTCLSGSRLVSVKAPPSCALARRPPFLLASGNRLNHHPCRQNIVIAQRLHGFYSEQVIRFNPQQFA